MMDQVPPLSEPSLSARSSRKIENRLFERFSARFPVKFRHTRSEYGADVFLRDASARGVRIATREKLFLNDSVSLDVKIPDGSDPVTLNGRIVWLHSRAPNLWDAGVELHEINLMGMQRIFRYVAPE